MIVLKLKGGLGNQLFQYAAAKQISLHYNVPLKLDLSFFDTDSSKHTYRMYELDKFKINVDIATKSEALYFNESLISILRLNKISEHNYWCKRNFIKWMNFGYVRGYWQSEKYFQAIKDVIVHEFVFKNQLDSSFDNIKEQIYGTNSVSIHFRRGDYVSNAKINKHHGTTSLDYYQKAIKHISQDLNNICLFVFSDDIEWVKLNFKTNYPVVYIEKSDNTNHSDFQLMSLCKHNIIANSTYSWWAAWLNRNPDKKIVAPVKWFDDRKSQKRVNEKIPATWTTI